jgi:Flp pilus assembly protein TadG
MEKLMINSLRRMLQCSSGGSAIVFSLSATVVLGAAGAGIDYGHAQMVKASLQSALDGAILAGVSTSVVPAKQISAAEASFARNIAEVLESNDAVFTVQGEKLVGNVTGTVDTTLLRVFGINSVQLAASSAGTAAPHREPLCIMAMHPTRKHTLEMKGSVKIQAPDCNIYGNSNHEYDVVDPHTPENVMTGKFIAAVGGGHHFLENVHPPVEFGTETIADPLADLSIPAPGACTQSNYVISGSVMTLPPGHYCGGLSIKNGAKVTLQPGGSYHISGGTFAIAASELSGSNVTIFLDNAGAKIAWQHSTIKLSAKKTGDYAGIAVYGARVETSNSIDESTIDIHGALYMPDGAFDWVNDGTPEIAAKWSAFIVDGFSWSGNGTININFNLKASDIPYPQELVVMPRPGLPRLIN